MVNFDDKSHKEYIGRNELGDERYDASKHCKEQLKGMYDALKPFADLPDKVISELSPWMQEMLRPEVQERIKKLLEVHGDQPTDKKIK